MRKKFVLDIIHLMIREEIKDEELLKHLQSIHKDEMTIFVMADGRVRGAYDSYDERQGTRFSSLRV